MFKSKVTIFLTFYTISIEKKNDINSQQRRNLKKKSYQRKKTKTIDLSYEKGTFKK